MWLTIIFQHEMFSTFKCFSISSRIIIVLTTLTLLFFLPTQPEAGQLTDDLEKVNQKSFYTKLNICVNKSTLFSLSGTTGA